MLISKWLINNFNFSLTNSKDFSSRLTFYYQIQHNIFIDSPGSCTLL